MSIISVVFKTVACTMCSELIARETADSFACKFGVRVQIGCLNLSSNNVEKIKKKLKTQRCKKFSANLISNNSRGSESSESVSSESVHSELNNSGTFPITLGPEVQAPISNAIAKGQETGLAKITAMIESFEAKQTASSNNINASN